MIDERFGILNELDRIRRSVRRRLVVYGVCAMAAGGCVSVLFVVAVDWLLELPPLLRIFGVVLFVIGFGLAAIRWLIRPMQTDLSLAQIAGKLERHYPGLNDRLSSTVSFLTCQPDASPALMRKVVDNTNRIVSRLQLRSALTYRPVLIQFTTLLAACGVLIAIGLVSPDWVRVGVHRFARPFDGLEWPRNVQIEPVTGRIRVAIGDSATVRMRIVRGNRPGLRSVVHLRDTDGNETALSMPGSDDGEYRCAVNAIATDLTYWFQSGDDDTRRTPGRIEVVRRPAVARITATVHPPSYAENAATIVTDMATDPARAVVGTTVTVKILSTKPMRTKPDGTADAWLELADGSVRALTSSPDNLRALTIDLIADRVATFHVHLVDRNGLASQGGQAFEIQTRRDQPPTVTLLEPRSLYETSRRGEVDVLVRTEDDFGLLDVRLVGHDTESKTRFAIPLLPATSITRSGQKTTGVTRYTWRIESLHLSPPATVVYRIEARDNCVVGDLNGQTTSSPTMRLNILSDADFESRLREEFALLRKRVRRAWLEQESIRDDTERAKDIADSAEAGDRAAGLANDQARLARGVLSLAEQFARFAGRMAKDASSESDSVRQVRRLRSELAKTGGGPMQEAAQALEQIERAGQSDADGTVRRDRLAEASLAQRRAADALKNMLEGMDRWGDFQALVTKTRDLVDRQQRLRHHTVETGRRTLGKRPQELTEELQAQLRQLDRSQQQLADELRSLVQRLRERANKTNKTDTATAAAIDDALRAAAAGETLQRMNDAAGALRENRLAGAAIHERSAQQGLAKMLAGLQEREMRRIAELGKRAEIASRAVARLRIEQEELLAATREAILLSDGEDVLVGQSPPQRQLGRNTGELGRELGESVDTAGAADSLRQASRSMSVAAASLDRSDGSKATLRQVEAIERLRDAETVLKERARNAAHAALRKRLAHIRTQLQTMLAQQRDINTETTQTIETVAVRKRLSRSTARRASKLARRQSALKVSADELREALARTVVYARVLGNISDDMGRAGKSLDKRRLDARLQKVQADIERRIGQLVRALAEAEALPPTDEFAEGGGGGGASGSDGRGRPPIPTAAELLMIRTIQQDLLADTTQHAVSATDVQPTEDQLERIESIGREQRELRLLTEMLVNKAGGR